MQGFCITVETADKLKEAAKRKEINIADMYTMTSKERRALFEKYVDKGTARGINAGFEKAQTSNTQGALKKWAEDTFTAKEKQTGKYRDIVSKINELNELGVLTPKGEDAFYEDLVATKLGVNVTREESGIIAEKATKLEELKKEDEFGLPTIEYLKAKREMDDYLDSLTPSSQLKVFTSIIARGSMLLSFKSPLLNIESNSIQGFMEAAGRRLSNPSLGGVNGTYAWKYAKQLVNIYAKTKYDLTRTMTLEDARKTLGEDITKSAGQGPVRKVGQFYEDVVFGKMLTLPDVMFASVHLADSININSTRLAKMQGLKEEELQAKALEIFKDASRPEPITPAGKLIRQQGVAEAQYATWTNKSRYSDWALKIREATNAITGDFRLGDNLQPFVKTPANVIGGGIANSGILLPIDLLIRMGGTIKDTKIGNIKQGESFKDASRENFAGFSRSVVRAGLGFTVAYLLSQMIQPDDFVGEYPMTDKERALFEAKNATPNSIRVNGKWISLDYFGPIASPLVGMLYAKKYGTTPSEKAFYYYKGVLLQATKIPGFRDMSDYYKTLTEDVERSSIQKVEIGMTNFFIDFLRARTIPALVSDIAIATDSVQRKTDVNKNPLEKTLAGIPSEKARGSLPEKRNVFGVTMPTEGWSQLLFGSRVKTQDENTLGLTKELDRLKTTGNLPSITNVEKTSTRAQALKEQLGDDKFAEALQEFNVNFRVKLIDLIYTDAYTQLDDPEKKTKIESIKDKTFDSMLKKYNYKKPEKK